MGKGVLGENWDMSLGPRRPLPSSAQINFLGDAQDEIRARTKPSWLRNVKVVLSHSFSRKMML
jgi:hypothetical protein